MTLAVSILMKDPAQAKTRLSGVLNADARESLALLLFESTLSYFARTYGDSLLGVVTASPRIAAIAHSHGAEPINEDGSGDINAAAAHAACWALARGADSLLVIHADIPTLVGGEFRALLEAGRSNAVVIAESADGGTNALLSTPPDAIPFHFGPRSAAAHQEAARAAGLAVARLGLPYLSRDIDTPDNLRGCWNGVAAGFSAFAVPGIPEVKDGDDLAALIGVALERAGITLEPRDVIVVAQKVVSKSEGRLRRLSDFHPSVKALEIAREIGKDPRKVEAILSESVEVLRARPTGADGLLVTRHREGWICANAGIDESNLGEGCEGMLLLPEDADRSAWLIRAGLEARFGGPLGVVVTDTFGRPWRQGLVNVAIGVAGVPAVVDWAGRTDANGRMLKVTMPAFADELAAVAGLLMQKNASLPVAVLRGLCWVDDPKASARDVLRPITQEMFL